MKQGGTASRGGGPSSRTARSEIARPGAAGMTAGPPGAGDEDRGKRAGDLRPVGGAIREKGGLLNPDSRPQDGEDGQERAPGGGALLADACAQSTCARFPRTARWLA